MRARLRSSWRRAASHSHIVARGKRSSGGSGFVASTLAMGQTQASRQVARLDTQKILASDWTAKLEVCGGHRRTDAGGKTIWLKLVNPTETKIRPHVKVRADANPLDPHWHDYFEDRAFFKKFGIHRKEAGLKPLSEPAWPSRGLCIGLSRMKGNFHVRF